MNGRIFDRSVMICRFRVLMQIDDKGCYIMSKQDNANIIRERFKKELINNGVNYLSPKDYEILFIYKIHLKSEIHITAKGIFYIHIWNGIGSCFWGARKELVDKLEEIKNNLNIPWYLILLTGRLDDDILNKRDYVADGYIIHEFIDIYRDLNISKDGRDLKIHKKNIESIQKYTLHFSIQELARNVAMLPMLPAYK